MDYVHLVSDRVLGSHPWEGGLDLLNIVMVGIAEPLTDQDGKGYELHRLLGALLSVELSAAEKFKIMEEEYNIKIDDRTREDVSEMCNLGQGVLEAGEARGIEKGAAQEKSRIIFKMYESGFHWNRLLTSQKKR